MQVNMRPNSTASNVISNMRARHDACSPAKLLLFTGLALWNVKHIAENITDKTITQ
jgi:hypothetical protein